MIFIGVENNGLIVLYDPCNFLIQIIEAALEFSVIVVDVIFQGYGLLREEGVELFAFSRLEGLQLFESDVAHGDELVAIYVKMVSLFHDKNNYL